MRGGERRREEARGGERRGDDIDILYRIPFAIEIYLISYLLSIPPLPFAPLFILFVYLSISFLFFSFIFDCAQT